ncbi:MAG: nucleotidyl transferase AbiEii/AbiGii toxin family protein [Candidatus Woesearchaeota archaeon]
MARILYILEEFLKEVEHSNPYGLVLKGGTALSLYCLNNHRESEDLDFDSDISNKGKHKEIERYFIGILEKLKEKQVIKDFRQGKSGLASTNRYHMKLELETHKKFQTKIDVDFVELPNTLKRKGELCLYSKERAFITKMLTFTNRKEFKDMYDIACLLPKIDTKPFIRNRNVIGLIDDILAIIEKEEILILYKSAFRNVDLRFKDLKQHQLGSFVSKLVKDLRILRNKLS